MSRTCCVAVEGYTFGTSENREVQTNSVLPNYFETIGVPLLLGRAFTMADIADPPRVVIVSKSMVRYFGARSPIGRRIGWGDPPRVRYDIEIVGVVEDLKTGNLRDATRPILYFPASGGEVIHVRASMDPAVLSATVRQAITKMDSNVLVRGLQTVTAIVESSLVVERVMATLAGFLGILALCLAAIGIYGVIEYSVRQRTQEIGVRIALGARPFTIVRMISREVLVLLAAGIVLGVLAALAFNQVLKAMLFGVNPSDRLNIAIAASLLAIVGVLAAIPPSRRAASLDPVTALRYE
jgi:predicted permease